MCHLYKDSWGWSVLWCAWVCVCFKYSLALWCLSLPLVRSTDTLCYYFDVHVCLRLFTLVGYKEGKCVYFVLALALAQTLWQHRAHTFHCISLCRSNDAAYHPHFICTHTCTPFALKRRANVCVSQDEQRSFIRSIQTVCFGHSIRVRSVLLRSAVK